MSDPDDKPAGPADSQSKSLFDSEWDALLGDTLGEDPSSSMSSPSFAPTPAGANAEDDVEAEAEAEAEPELREADSVPRNSTAQASVSGAYLGPKPRPDPKTPPRYERPEGVSPYYDDPDEPYGDPDADTGDYGMAPRIEPAILELSTMAQNLGLFEPQAKQPAESGDEPKAEVIELPTARTGAGNGRRERDESTPPEQPLAKEHGSEPPGSSDAATGEDAGGGGRGTMIVVGLLAAAGLIAVAVTQLGGGEQAKPDTVATSPTKPTPPITREPTRTPQPTGTSTGTGGTETSGGNGSEEDTGDEAETGDTGGDETGGWQPKPQPKPSNVDPRDPSLIPPGTPEDNAKAFTKLPVSIHDGPPVGGIGRSGIHIDAISTSRGRENTECDNPTETFSLGVAKYVNVCFRIVHPREQESLRVIWEKDGKVTRRGRVRVPELHAYTTRAYLSLRPEYVGDWRVRIVPEGEESIDLAVAEFVITE